MRIRINLPVLLFTICSYATGQHTIDLTTGNKHYNSPYSELPQRNIIKQGDGYTVSYSFQDLTISDDPLYNGASSISVNGFNHNTEVGKPEILFRWDSFLVPAGKTYSVTVVDSSYVDIPLVLSPSRPLLMNSSSQDYDLSNVLPISSYSGLYPEGIIMNIGQASYRGNSIIDLCVCPVKYDYSNHLLRVFKSFSYHIEFEDIPNRSRTETNPMGSDTFLNNLVLNGVVQERNTTTVQTEVTKDYLILSTSTFEDEVNRFADWKRSLGYRVHIVLRNDWDSSMVKSEVLSKYNSLNNLYYLLIFGDHEDIPAECSSVNGNSCYTDFNYGCIDNDNIQDIHTGRIPASTANEAHIIVDKIIKYEETPVHDVSFYNTGVNCAFFENVGNTESSGRYVQTTEEIRSYMESLGKNIKRVYYAYPSCNPQYWYGNSSIPSELTKPGFSWSGNADSIKNHINSGAFYVFHRDHGDADCWFKPYFDKTDIQSLSNGDKQPIVFSVNCSTGKFTQSGANCFAEEFLKKQNGGCVSIIAATENSYTYPNNFFAAGIFDAIWPDPGLSLSFCNINLPPETRAPIYAIGEVLNQAKLRMKDTTPSSQGSLVNYNTAIFHCLGDPSMEIITELPSLFNNVQIDRGSNQINVTLFEEAVVSFYDKSNNNVSSYAGTQISYTGNSDNVIVSIKKHNKIPYIDYPDTLFIQNQTVSGPRQFSAEDILVGSNVNSSMTSGQVVFDGNSISLSAKNIEIQGTTSVTLGTQLEIQTHE